MKKVVLSLALTALLAACASDPKPAETTTPATGATATKPAEQVKAAPEKDPFADKTGALQNRDNRYVFFDYNEYAVKDQYQGMLKLHADYVTSKWYTKSEPVSIEGHADERGTAEYNMALGQKRAEAVKNIMVSVMGVPADKLDPVSYGEERPMVKGHNEEAWAKNRRAIIVYPGEYLP